MRDMKCRGLDIHNVWQCGSLVQTIEGECLIVAIYGRNVRQMVKVEEATVCQYSGFTDSAGNDIFEGDHVKEYLCNGKEETFCVEYKDGCFYAVFPDSRQVQLSWELRDRLACKVRFEVTGNKFTDQESSVA